jgi:hypothetical protein
MVGKVKKREEVENKKQKPKDYKVIHASIPSFKLGLTLCLISFIVALKKL